MQRITTLLDKIAQLAKNDNKSVIELDLMLDYTRVMYADLLEQRTRQSFNESLAMEPTKPVEPKIEDLVITTSKEIDKPAPPVHEEKITIELQTPVQTEINPSKDIRSFIAINDKYSFISELFSNNKDAYNEVLDEINQMESYQETTEWLEMHVAPQYSWDKENPTVHSFYATLSQFFSSI